MMKFAPLLAALCFASSMVFAAPALNEEAIVLSRFTKRADPQNGRHMLSMTFDQTLFDQLSGMIKDVLPAQVDALTVPTLAGDLPPLLNIPFVTGATVFNISNIDFKNATVSNSTAITLNDGAAGFSVGIELVVEADYYLKVKLGLTNEYKGKLSMIIKGGVVSGDLAISGNGGGGLAVSLVNMKSELAVFDIVCTNSLLLGWMSKFGSLIARPIVASTLGTVVGTAIPPIVNVLFANSVNFALTMPGGKKLDSHIVVTGAPKIKKGSMVVDLDLITN